MKKYIELLTEHLKQIAQLRSISYAESEIKKVYDKMRKEFLDKFFSKIADKCDSIFQLFEEHDDYILLSIRFKDPKMPNGDYPSKYKLYPFHAEVTDCATKTRATQNLDLVQQVWIDTLSQSLGESYTNDLKDHENDNSFKPE